MTAVNHIALCPDDGREMSLLHRSVDMDAWFCDGCGEHRTVLRRGVDWLPHAPPDTLHAGTVEWVQRAADPRHGRIDDEEGG